VVSFHDELPFEVFVYIGKAGGELSPYIESIGRLVSISLRSGLPLDEVIEQLESAGGRYDPPTLPDGLSIVLRAVQKKVSPSQLIEDRRKAVGQ
jgi:hypothetical protein